MSRYKNTKQEDEWIEEGRQAALSGKPDSECPYLFQFMARAAWFIGWERGGGNMKTGKVEDKR